MISPAELFRALTLPASASVNTRIPKKLLLENGAPTAADKRLLQDRVDELLCLAILKPGTVGISGWSSEGREYSEIAVLQLQMRPGKASPRLQELIHRAIPYPVLLICQDAGQTSISLACKRIAQRDSNRLVLEDPQTALCLGPADHAWLPDFLAALALTRQRQASLYELYLSWHEALLALLAARASGRFSLVPIQQIPQRRQFLQQVQELEVQIATLRRRAAKEKQSAKQVALNLEIKQAQALLQSCLSQLHPT